MVMLGWFGLISHVTNVAVVLLGKLYIQCKISNRIELLALPVMGYG